MTTRREHWVERARPPRGPVTDIRRIRDPDDVGPFLSDAAHFPGGHTDEVCFPSTEADVAAILRDARSVLAVGAQSSLTGGATPRGDVVLATTRMAGIRAWRDGAVVVGPGLVLRELLTELAARDLYYPPVPTFDGATVGGTVATNAAGAAAFKYGTTRDWVNGLTIVLATGDVLDVRRGDVTARDDGVFEIVRVDGSRLRAERPRLRMPDVPKHSAGYWSAPGMDLIDLFIGSEGTLGVVTEVELRVVGPRPSWLVVLAFPADESAAVTLVDELRRESIAARTRAGGAEAVDVAAVEYLDARSLDVLRADGVPERVGVALPASARAAVLVQAELPAGTTADRAAEELARLDDATCATPLVRLCRILDRHGVLAAAVPALPGEDRKRDAVFALREAVPEGINRRVREAQRERDSTIAKAACDVIVPFPRFGESLAAYRAILERRGLDHAIWGHISDGNVHPNVLARSAQEMASAKEALVEIGDAAIALGGCPMSEHGTGRDPVKKRLLTRLYGADAVASMRDVKRALDPRGVLAPGVVFDLA